jgi:hypothetical protein
VKNPSGESRVFRILKKLIRPTDSREVDLAIKRFFDLLVPPRDLKDFSSDEVALYYAKTLCELICDLRDAVENQDRILVLVELKHYIRKFEDESLPIPPRRAAKVIIDSEFYQTLGPKEDGKTHVNGIKRSMSGLYRKIFPTGKNIPTGKNTE